MNPIRLKLTTHKTHGWPGRLPARSGANGQAWQPSAGQGAAALVQAILARCLPATPRQPILTPIYRQARPAALTQHYGYTQTIVSPRLQLTLLMPAASRAPGNSPPDASLTWRVVRPPAVASSVDTLVRRLHSREALEVATRNHTVQRLITRVQRLETVASHGSPLTPRPSPASSELAKSQVAAESIATLITLVARPVPRIVHRPVMAQPSAGSPPLPSTQPGLISMAESPTFRPEPATAGAIDVNRLTEQIMQNIDRRITAYRERTGRI